VPPKSRRSRGIFGAYGLLSLEVAAKEYATELKVRKKVGDAGTGRTPRAVRQQQLGGLIAVDAETGAVIDAYNDRGGLDRWVA
jgi:hypothetical protein